MPRPITSQDLYAIKVAEDPRLSPDGTKLAYVLMQIDGESYQYRRSIWISPVPDGPPRSFSSGHLDSQPRWSPDGTRIAFLRTPAAEIKATSTAESERGIGKPQIYVISTSGGEAEQLTFMRHGAGSFVWSPDSGAILFTSRTGEPDDQEAENAALQGKALPRVRSITQMAYRFDGQGFTHDLRSHLFTIPAAGGQAEQITDGDWNDGDPTWSPDGKRIAFTSDRSEQRWQWPAAAVWVLDLATGSCEQLTDETLGCSTPTWSPTDDTIAFLASPRRHAGGHTDLYTVSSQPGGEAHQRSRGFVPTCRDACISDMCVVHGEAHMVWSSDGEIYFLASMRGTTHVYALHAKGDLPPRRVTSGDVHVYAFSLDAACSRLALGISNPTMPGDIYTLPIQAEDPSSSTGTEPQRLTNSNAALLNEVELAAPREFTFVGADGWELQGWMYPTAPS